MPIPTLLPSHPPLISRVCRRARATALRCGQYAEVLVEEEDDVAWSGSMWLNKKSDGVYFDYSTMVERLDDCGATSILSRRILGRKGPLDEHSKDNT